MAPSALSHGDGSPGAGATHCPILLFHIIRARPSKQPRMVGSTLGIYRFGLIFASARTNKGHHLHLSLARSLARARARALSLSLSRSLSRSLSLSGIISIRYRGGWSSHVAGRSSHCTQQLNESNLERRGRCLCVSPCADQPSKCIQFTATGPWPTIRGSASAPPERRKLLLFITAVHNTKLCAWGEEDSCAIVGDMCYEIRRAEACVE